MDSSFNLKKALPIALLAVVLGGVLVKTQFPQWLPLSMGGSLHSPLETKARHFSQTAGLSISGNCNNSGNAPKIRHLGFQELKNDKLKIHLEVKWTGLLGMPYHVKGWATCNADGTNPKWQNEDSSLALIPGCYSDLGDSLE